MGLINVFYRTPKYVTFGPVANSLLRGRAFLVYCGLN